MLKPIVSQYDSHTCVNIKRQWILDPPKYIFSRARSETTTVQSARFRTVSKTFQLTDGMNSYTLNSYALPQNSPSASMLDPNNGQKWFHHNRAV